MRGQYRYLIKVGSRKSQKINPYGDCRELDDEFSLIMGRSIGGITLEVLFCTPHTSDLIV